MATVELRNLPCTVGDWCVIGETDSGGGVLEWCYDEEDARSEIERLSKDPRYKNLDVGYSGAPAGWPH